MKLLLDQNLSPRLAENLIVLFPDSAHVRHLGLERAGDEEVWRHARDHEHVLVSNDADFRQPRFSTGSRKS